MSQKKQNSSINTKDNNTMSDEVFAPNWRVIKAVGGKFWLKSGKKQLVANARGKILLDDEIIPGDFVLLDLTKEEAHIESVLERKNKLIRPLVANVDQIVLLIAPLPAPDFVLIDKLIIACIHNKLDIVFCLNKTDILQDDSFFEDIVFSYSKDVSAIIKTCASQNDVSQLLPHLAGKLSCFAGQSAVGKSSLINCLLPHKNLEVGELSQKNQRGKHTTRHTEIFEIDNGGLIADTPGFSKLSSNFIRFDELNYFYNEYVELKQNCKFSSCTHIDEPLCAVRAAAQAGEISAARYARYKDILKEIKDNSSK